MAAEMVLVTGASGFVGRQVLAPLREAGYAVHGLARQGDLPPLSGIMWHRADLMDRTAMRALLERVRPGILVHAAWYARHGLFWTAPENEDWREASRDLAQAFAETGGRRFIGLGSCAEYDWDLPGDGPWPESRPLRPATPYGSAKRATFLALDQMARAGRFDFAWIRLFHLFGPEEQPGRLVPMIRAALVRGEPALLGPGHAVRDMVDTGFAGRAIARIATAPLTGAVNLGAGRGVPIADLARRLGSLLGRPDLIRLGALPERPGEPPHMVADVTRLRDEAGFGERFDLDHALACAVGAAEVPA